MTRTIKSVRNCGSSLVYPKGCFEVFIEFSDTQSYPNIGLPDYGEVVTYQGIEIRGGGGYSGVIAYYNGSPTMPNLALSARTLGNLLKPEPMSTPELLQKVALSLVATVNATGGIVTHPDGTHGPVGDPDWVDLADAYCQACRVLHVQPILTLAEPIQVLKEPGQDFTQDFTALKAEQLLAKFPHLSAHAPDSMLQDWACPNCGGRWRFAVAFQGTCEVRTSGTVDTGDHEWEETSACVCLDCDHRATVADFTFKGLDDLINQVTGKVGKA